MGMLTVLVAEARGIGSSAEDGIGKNVEDVGRHGVLSYAFCELARRIERGGEDLGIGAAAAKVAGDGVAHIGFSGMRILLEQRGAAHDHARSAETALHGIMADEGSLHGMQLLIGGEAFDGGDLMADRVDEPASCSY